MPIKSALLNHCLHVAQEKVQALEDALSSTRQSATSEGKSTAGDKHETGRAMMHLEQEKLLRQLAEAQALLAELQKTDATAAHTKVGLGALVETDKGTFFLAAGLGKIDFEGESYFAISAKAPIAQQLMGKVAGEHIRVNAMVYTIKTVE